MATVAEKVSALIKPTVEAQGVKLWDVRFLKEGASYYLRVFIDSENGIGIDECTAVSHAIDPIIDEADPIDKSYYLEVCSAGLNRELTKEEHYLFAVGKNVMIKLFKAENGIKGIRGVLLSYKDGQFSVNSNGETVTVSLKNTAKINTEDF